MSAGPVCITTARLLLRRWRASDREPFARMNADPRVMEWFPRMLSAEESAATAEVIEARVSAQGWGAVGGRDPRRRRVRRLGRAQPGRRRPRLHRGRGRLAARGRALGARLRAGGARASLAYGFDTLALDEVVSFTSVGNAKSRRVMEKIGMTRDPGQDFDHPRVPHESPLCRHVLYRIARPAFEEERAAIDG